VREPAPRPESVVIGDRVGERGGQVGECSCRCSNPSHQSCGPVLGESDGGAWSRVEGKEGEHCLYMMIFVSKYHPSFEGQ
jgi:hypothetical protein